MADLFQSLIQQESSGRPGVVGPPTKYGRALGLTQMLPATAQEMARKLGVPWNPALMTDKSPRGAEYQTKLGQAYFQEGLQKTGNERDALRYYHGGPNRSMWGPKTNAYADSVLARANKGSAMPLQPRKPQTLGDVAQRPMQPPLAALPQQQPQQGGILANMTLPGVGGQGGQPGVPELPHQSALGKAAPYILAAISDAIKMHNGMQPNAVQGLQDMNQHEADQQFDRERWSQQLQAQHDERMARAAEPPAFVRNAQAYASLDPSAQSQVQDFYRVTNPQFTNVEQQDGSVRRMEMPSGPQPGAEEDGYVFLGGDPADPKSWRPR